MKLLLDENLSPRLIKQLSDLYPGSAHVQQCGLGSTADGAIWEYAKSNGFTIVSKDSDFEERSILSGSPPKLIWIRAKNCTSAASFWDPGMEISRGAAHRLEFGFHLQTGLPTLPGGREKILEPDRSRANRTGHFDALTIETGKAIDKGCRSRYSPRR